LNRGGLIELMTRIAARDRLALRDLYDHTSAKLFGVALRILGEHGEAEEILQEVYVTVWEKAAAFDGERASPITWLATITRNRAIDRKRRLSRTTLAEPGSPALDRADPGPGPAESLDEKQMSARMDACIEELDPKYAAVIRDAFFGGLTYADIAARDGIALGTIKGWMRRSFARLKECLSR